MGKRMKALLKKYDELSKISLTKEEATLHRAELLTQIQFMQHERLVHLIVTVLFALLTVLTLYISLVITQPLLLVLAGLFLVLLVPYIGHYYLLENGVQKLYEYYDRLNQ